MLSQKKTSAMPFYLAWLAAALFYFYQYILRVSPGVMVTDLRQEFRLTAEEFASFGAWYLYAYALLQIPIGIIMDRIGIRRTVLGSIMLCVGGVALLGWAESLYAVQFSRILVGAGSACAFMAGLKVAADWLPAGKRGFLIGATLTFGTIGALTAGRPQVWLIDSIGWRSTVFTTAYLGLAVFCLVLFMLKLPEEPRAAQKSLALLPSLKQIKHIIFNWQIMIYALLAIGLYAPLSVLADLWGTAFLMQKYGLKRADAAQTSMMMYLGLALGSLILPWICEKYGILNRAIKLCGLAILLAFAFILFGPQVSILCLSTVLIALGFFCGAEMMCFTGAVHYTTRENSGMTIGVVNTLNMLGGALLQQGIGWLLDRQWGGSVDSHGVRIYSAQEFVVALSLLLIAVVACCLVSLKLKPDDKLI
jgi:sugar phosphate permease